MCFSHWGAVPLPLLSWVPPCSHPGSLSPHLPASEMRSPFPGPSRRGSNVSLTLDMCTPGCGEEGFGYLMSPREESAREYLLSASRVLQADELHEKALDPFLLQAEFFVSPPEPAPHRGQTFLSAHISHTSSQAVVWGAQNAAPPRLMTFPYQLSRHLGQAASPLSLSFLIWKMGIKITGMLQGLKRRLTCAEHSAW